MGSANQPTENKKKASKTTIYIVVAVVVIIIVAAVAVSIYYEHKPTTTTSPPAKRVTITVWGSGSAGGEAQAFNETLASFEAQYPNITVKDSPAINVASTTFPTAAHAHDAPDVYRDTSDNGGALYTAGLLLNLTPYLNSSYINEFTKGTITDWTINGSIYGVPVNTNGIALYYNKALVPNGQPPSTLYQMIRDAENVTAMGSGYYGLAYGIGNDYGYRFAAFFPAFGGQIFNSSLYPVVNSSQDIAAMSFVWNWTVKYHVDTVGLTFSDEQSLFESGKSAFMFDGPWDQSIYEKALGSNLGVAPIPFNNATGLWPEPLWGSVGYVIASPQASGANASQIWASLKFVEYMTNFNSQVLLFKLAGDLPSMVSVGSYIDTHNFNDTLITGWIQQESHTQLFPNFPQMAAYWTPFHVGATNLEQNSSKVTVAQVMNQIEALMIQTLKSEGIPLSIVSLSIMPKGLLPSMIPLTIVPVHTSAYESMFASFISTNVASAVDKILFIF